MDPNLSSYPPTMEGTKDILTVLTPAIRKLWRSEREQHNSDDLVVVIDTRTGTVKLSTRSSTYSQLIKHNQKISLLPRLKSKAPSPNGTITIWSIIGFAEGPVFISPVVLARS
jgi:hypothetical protein